MPYHHGNLKSTLIDAAVDIAAQGGPDAISLRDIARTVGVSHAAAYRHIADRDALIQAVAERALSMLGTFMAERIATLSGSRGKKAAWARLAESGRSYADFATSHPGLFHTIGRFPLGELRPDDPSVDHPYQQLVTRLDELEAVGAISAAGRVDSEIAALAAVHGFAVLFNDTPYRRASSADREVALAKILVSLQHGIGAVPT